MNQTNNLQMIEMTPPESSHYIESVNYYGTAKTGKRVLEIEENNLDNRA
ncbi:MAG: hypothetical protein ACL7BU_06365 [Candidatus Phlomobacter fragariae]